MNAAELVSEMRSRGVSVYLDGGRLRCSGPPGAVTEEIRRALTTHKADIAAALSQPPRRASPAIQPTSGSVSPPRMSYAQKRLWFLDRLEPRSASYNIALALRLIGELDRGAFEAALDEIVHRHDVLRSSFVERDGEPVQVIRASSKIETPVVDLAGVEASRREAEARRLLREEASRPFDLAEDPLLRWLVIDLGCNETREPEHIVALTLHHIVSDGWSTAVLTREFAILYEAFAAGRASPLPPLSLQYADYATWQQEWLRGEMLERQLAYWRNELSGALSVLELPTDRPRPRKQDHSGATHRFVVNEKTTRALRTLGREENATLFMTLLAAFQILLARHSGQTDICVGSPVANRRLVELEDLIGCFVNTLVLRGDVSGNPSFRDFLARVRETALGAQEHQDVPFERLVEELQPQRDPSRSSLFQALFVLQNAPASELKLSGLRIEPMATSSGATKFDLSLSVIEHDGQLFAQFDYATALFDAETIAGLADRYVALLAGIVADPLCRLGDLPMLDADELRRVLFAWNAARQDGPSDMCVHELFEKQATLTPDADAVVFEGVCLTYRELNVRANRLAHRLIAAKVGVETVVGLCVERSLEMVVGLLAVLKAGGAYVPLDP
ncbi:MAG: non-ribosomal peptide synthetase, partial [Methylocystaceae bacterium]